MEYNMLDKEKLIVELREIHKELVSLYEDIFNYKYDNDEEFKFYIDNQYSQNGIRKKDQMSWNQNFCHRTSYTLLNKILFVRICEDKGFMRNPEDYILGEVKNPHIGEKLSKIGLQKWSNIVTNLTFGELINFAFKDMKKSYSNIVLYKENKYEILNPTGEELNLKYIDGHKKTKKHTIEFERILSDLIERLDTERFNFKKTDSNILGDVYENFMDIETRKAIGQFYTPDFIIEYILKNTVEETDVLENPFVRVADISCGSGHFLIMAYDILRKKFTNTLEKLRNKYTNEKYVVNRNGKEEEILGKEYWIEENIHYHILKHCIYGADIDSFAVQLTTINLLLKDLDNFTDELNIIECDSLIKWEEDYNWKDLKKQLKEEYEEIETTHVNLFGEEERISIKQRRENYNLRYQNIVGTEKIKKVNRREAEEIISICKFWSNQFNYIIGNPPYVSFGLKRVGKLDYNMSDYIRANYPNSAEYKISYYALFFDRAIEKLESLGMLGYITPDSFLLGRYFSKVRRLILDECNINKFTLYYDRVFSNATIGTATISILGKNLNSKNNYIATKKISDKKSSGYSYPQKYFEDQVYNRFKIYFSKRDFNIINKIDQYKTKLSDFVDIKTGMRSLTTQNDIKSDRKEGITWKKGITSSSQIKKWELLYEGDWLDVNPKKLNSGGWDKDTIENDKILIRQTGDSLIASIDREKHYHLNNCHSISLNNKGIDLEYILCLLNSNLYNFYYHITSLEKGRAMAQINIETLEKLPIKIDNSRRDELVHLVTTLEKKIKEKNNLHFDIEPIEGDIKKAYIKHKNKKNKLNDEIDAIDNRINKIIYKIYEVSAEDIIYIDKIEGNNKLRKNEKNDGIYNKISNYIQKEIKEGMKNKYLNINNFEFSKTSENVIKSLDIIREKNPTKKSVQIIKEILNKDSYTWNAYRKIKDKNRINKTFMKYYDSNYYGLSEWSDEIHKHYFLDAIDEYTETDPNEKKAKDIFKLFKDLDIEDKKDYLSVIEGKINRVFK